jgi:hypothetical protein
MQEKLKTMRGILAEIAAEHPSLVVDEVDMSEDARRKVARFFFDRDDLPMKAWNGSPFYAYLYGLYKADADFVVHFDGDMFFGGGSQSWLSEAIEMFVERDDCLFVGPLPGPPRQDGALLGHGEHWRDVTSAPVPGLTHGRRFSTVSTRVFVTNLELAKRRVGRPFGWLKPDLRRRTHARLLGNPPETMELERVLSADMAARGLTRLDFLGSAPGMWTLHPPHRPPEFYERLPGLIERVECGDMPDAQRGHYDFTDALLDCRAERRGNRRSVRWSRHTKRVTERLFSARMA